MLLEKLHEKSGVSLSKLDWIAQTASRRYKVYEIPKRTGGTRTIAHPSRALKAIQRWICAVVIKTLPVHESSTAYSKGSGIRQNAERHMQSEKTVRIDFRDFFPSFQSHHVKRFLFDNNSFGLSAADIDFVCAIVARNDQLAIGAPSSPTLTNAMMHRFDSELADIARTRRLIYSRYADDIFISSQKGSSIAGIEAVVGSLCAGYLYANLRINDDKTAYLSRRYKRSITGLVITSDRKISLGRDKKREIKALVHRHAIGTIESDRLQYLKGYLAFASDAEPEFVLSLKIKYGEDRVLEIMG